MPVSHVWRLKMTGGVMLLILLTLVGGCARATQASLPADGGATVEPVTATSETLRAADTTTTPLLMAMGNLATTSSRVILYTAAVLQDRPTIQALKLRGADLNEADPDLHQTALHQVVMDGNLPAARLLLDEGADPDIYGGSGTTALFDAISLNQYAMAALLLGRGADPNLPEHAFRFTPLHPAATDGDTTATRLLLRYKADPNALNANDVTPLHMAASGGRIEVVRMLLEAGADPTLKTKAGRTVMDVARDRAAQGENGAAVLRLLERSGRP